MTNNEQSTTDLMYGSDDSLHSDYGPALRHSVNRLADVAGWSAEEADSHLRDAARTYYNAGVRSGPASIVHDVIAQHIRQPADQETVKSWEIESRRMLREKFGLVEADKKLERVREYLNENPAVAKLLRDTGVGSHPDVVRTFVENANRI